jgi:hypothetical protein
MLRDWTISACMAAASLTLIAGCAKSIPSTDSAARDKVYTAAPSEPAPFKTPTGVALKHIGDVENFNDRGARTTSNEEQEKLSPQSVLKRSAPKEKPEAPRPLPQRNDRARGDFAAVEKRARQVIDQAFKLADRGAIYSARSDLLSALEVLCDARDSINGNRVCTKALGEALIAMEEAADFLPRGETRSSLKSVVDGHKTTVLKKAKLDEVSNILAMHRYNTFAQQKLIEAGGGSPAASEALCGLGKIARQLPASDASSRRNVLSSALVFQLSAIEVWNENYHAANESGVLYALLGRPNEAKQILVEVAETTNWPTAWANLARVHEQLKEFDLAEAATNEMRFAQKANPHLATSKIGPSEFRWVSPEQFVAEGPNGASSVAGKGSAAQKR